METKGKALIDHWSWAAEKGVMNKHTAAGLRAACVQVLGVLDDPDQADVASLDVDDLLTRFQNLRKQRFKPQVLEAYKRRFRSAVKSYKDYLENPGAWKPVNQDRSASSDRRPRTSNASAPDGSEIRVRSQIFPQTILDTQFCYMLLHSHWASLTTSCNQRA